jgi:hypothetical protein
LPAFRSLKAPAPSVLQGLKAQPASQIYPQKHPKICQKNLPRAVFAAFLAKIMQDSLHLDA